MWQHSNDLSCLAERLRRQRLLEPAPLYYAIRILIHLALLCACMVILFARGAQHTWLQIALAAAFAFVQGQLGIIVHDAGHGQICRAMWKNRAIGLLHANVIIGVSFDWWVHKHNKHHSHPNQIGLDPDIDMPFFAFCPEQAAAKIGIRREIVKYQAFFLPALIFLEAISLKFDSVAFLLHLKNPRVRRVELLLIIAHHVIYLGFLIYVLGFGAAILFFVVAHALLGAYLSLLFLPNHVGMPVFSESDRVEFLRHQISATRNIRHGLVVDYLYGPLAYQIEHHLFPRIPLNKLGMAREIVRCFCEERQMQYYEVGVLQSYCEILSFLHRVGASLRHV